MSDAEEMRRLAMEQMEHNQNEWFHATQEADKALRRYMASVYVVLDMLVFDGLDAADEEHDEQHQDDEHQDPGD